MYNLGVFYARGLGGVEPDVDRARDLFKRAARLGQKDAEQALILEEESREEISYKKEADESIIDNFSAAFSTGNLLESFNLRGKKDKRPEPDLLWNEGDSLNDSKSSLDNDSGVLDMSPQTEADDFFARLL